jgi:hypothetical protein
MSDIIETHSDSPQPQEKGFSVLALISTLTGIFSYFLVLLHSAIHMKPLVAMLLAPFSALAAIITGHISHRQIKASDGTLTGIKLSRTGLVLGYLYFALGVLALILVALGAAWLIHLING